MRFAGVYALSRLADDWPEQRQARIEFLCAYQPTNGQPADADEGLSTNGQPADDDLSVRLAIQRIIREHLQEGVKNSWSNYRLNFKNAVLQPAHRLRAMAHRRDPMGAH